MTEAVSNVTWQNNTVSSELAECRVIWEPRSRTPCPGLMGEWSGISLEMCPVSWDMKEKRDWSGRFWEEETLLGEKPRQQRTRYFWGTETCLARLGNRCWWSGARSARRRWGGQGRQVSEPATGRSGPQKGFKQGGDVIRDVLGEDRVGSVVKKTLGGKRLEVAGSCWRLLEQHRGGGMETWPSLVNLRIVIQRTITPEVFSSANDKSSHKYTHICQRLLISAPRYTNQWKWVLLWFPSQETCQQLFLWRRKKHHMAFLANI